MAQYGGTVIDLGCGIGGDLIALSRVAPDVLGVDLDPVRARIALANLTGLGLGGSVLIADVTRLNLSTREVLVADPTSCTARGRVFEPTVYTPPWSFVESLLARTSAVMVAPGIPHDLVPDSVGAEWVSDDGGVKEALLVEPM